MSPVLPTGRIAHLGMEETAAGRDFNAAYDRSGSMASHPDVRDTPGMSAMPPEATQSVRRNKASRCAISGREQTHQQMQLVDHVVGESQQPVRHVEVECPGCLEVEHELEFG